MRRSAPLLLALAAALLLPACDSAPVSCEDTGAVTVQDRVVGSGQAATPTSTITADYVGTLADGGDEFDRGTIRSLSLRQLVAGFGQGVGGRAATDTTPAIAPMRIGGQRVIRVPTNLAYGTRPPSADIPACADLVFEVTLRDLN